jgi:hypothetical protein
MAIQKRLEISTLNYRNTFPTKHQSFSKITYITQQPTAAEAVSSSNQPSLALSSALFVCSVGTTIPKQR